MPGPGVTVGQWLTQESLPMRTCLVALALTLVLPRPGAGQGSGEPAVLEVGAGVPRVLDDSRGPVGMVGVRLPVRILGVSPLAALLGDSRGEFFALAGVFRDFTRGAWRLTPMFAAGAYERGDGRDLGSRLQFRSAVEVSRALAGGHRLGAQIAHTSNAGLGSRNPGQERLLVTWLIPF